VFKWVLLLRKARPLEFRRANKRLKFNAISDNVSKIGKKLDQLQPLPRWAKKDCELWSTNKKVIDWNVDPPKSNFSTGYISALRGCWPLKFKHALEIDQGLVAHAPNGDGGPSKKFKGKHVKLGLKFRALAPITLGVVGITSRNFSTRRAARQGCSSGSYFWGRPAP